MKGVFGKVLPALLVAVGAFSGTADAACGGTLYFKKPSSWTAAYVVYENTTYATTTKDGWDYIDLNKVIGGGWGRTNFGIGNSTDIYNSTGKVLKTVWDGTGDIGNSIDTDGIPCPGTGNTVYVQENPTKPGTTYIGENPSGASYVYFLVPDDKDWQSDVMMISADGGAGVKMNTAPDMCGWYMMAYEKAPSEIVFYRSTDPNDKIGYEGFAGAGDSPTALPFKDILDNYNTKTLYFIPDESQWPEGKEDTHGLFTSDPGASGVCTFDLAAVIYDTDVSVNDLFSEYQGRESTLASQCVGVRTGIVKEDLGPDNKPELNKGSANAKLCFNDNPDLFYKLFHAVDGTNEVVCYDLPFSRAKDGRWAYDSDQAKTGTQQGGFYPRENGTNADVITSMTKTMCPDCRNKLKAEGPVIVTLDSAALAKGIPDLDHLCNGPGWDGGIDCEGKFISDDLPGYVKYTWDKGPDKNARWSGTRNEHFCFESHAKFTYHEDQEFAFRGDDDIWVFINKKLVVDNGGAHLATPGYVVLKNLNKPAPAGYGANFLVEGKEYSLDIFFCDRRTTQSNVIIKTNMFIRQTSGLSTTSSTNSGAVTYNVCYDKSGDGSCASVALGQSSSAKDVVHACGKDISKYGNLKYRIATRGGEQVADLTAGTSGMQYGGFDLSDPYNPKVYPDKINKLSPGSYRLVIEFCDTKGKCDEKSKTYINFRIKGNLDIMTKTSKYTWNQGDEKSTFYTPGTVWTFVDKGLAGTRVPVYISAFADGEVDLLSAVGQSYSLVLSKGMNAYATETGTETIKFPRTVGASGIDTVWLEQSLAGMTARVEAKTAQLKSTASINFYAPQLEFATPVDIDSTGKILSWKHPVAGDPDTLDGEEFYHWIGSDVDLYVLIVNPITGDVCRECSVTLMQYDASAGVKVSGASAFTDGYAVVAVRSSKEYMDSTAYVSITSDQDVNLLMLASYINLRFREPPVPYPQLVDLFDAHGKSQGDLSIPEPYYSESKEYLDGKADSIAIYYHRAFMPGPSGDYKDSLPDLICLNWDEDNLVTRNFKQEGISTLARDSAVQCSYIFSKEQIMAAHKSRKADNMLIFAVKDTAFSALVKTAGNGKVLSFATFEDRKKISKQHFDRNVTDRIAPVIIGARVDNVSDQLSRLTVTLSEPVQMLNDTYSKAPFSFYMNSAGDVSKDKRYASSTANAAPKGLGTDQVVLVYDKTQGTTNPVPRLGDYIRFRADAMIWRDISEIASEDITRAAADSSMRWNSPTDYKETKRVPSPWFMVVGDYSVEVSAVKLATMNKDIDANNTPIVEAFVVPTNLGTEDIQKLYPNTLGFIVKSDISSFVSRDPRIEEYFNNNEGAWEDVYFQYETQYYTNLGNYVAGDKQKIYCLDKVNKEKYNKEYYGGKDCRTTQGNFYIAWNMLSDKKRLVGTGAYIAKLSSFVKLGEKGKAKGSKAEETDMWGAKRGKGIIKK